MFYLWKRHVVIIPIVMPPIPFDVIFLHIRTFIVNTCMFPLVEANAILGDDLGDNKNPLVSRLLLPVP